MGSVQPGRAMGSPAQVKFFMYLVLDCSSSMGVISNKSRPQVEDSHGAAKSLSPWSVAREAIHKALEGTLARNKEVRALCNLGILAFNDSVTEVRKALEPGHGLPVMPTPAGYTDFRTLFEQLDVIVSRDMRAARQAGWRTHRPAVYMLTDGQPMTNQGAQPPRVFEPVVRAFQNNRHERLDRRGDVGTVTPVVVPFGVGNAKEGTLCLVKTSRWPAYIANSPDIGGDVERILRAIIQSISFSAASAELVVPNPRGARKVQCPGE